MEPVSSDPEPNGYDTNLLVQLDSEVEIAGIGNQDRKKKKNRERRK
jgi:hypothetical protein